MSNKITQPNEDTLNQTKLLFEKGFHFITYTALGVSQGLKRFDCCIRTQIVGCLKI